MGHGNSFQRKFFCYAGSATHPSSQFDLCLSASPSLWHYRANATYDADFAFPPWSSLLRWVANSCVDSVFCSRFQSRHSLPLHSHGGLGPPSSYPWQFCRFIYFGFRLVRAGFGYAESAFSVFGLSELSSAMPRLSFRLSACPS